MLYNRHNLQTHGISLLCKRIEQLLNVKGGAYEQY